MFAGLINLFKKTFRMFVQGVKEILGISEEVDSEEMVDMSNKAVAVAVAAVALFFFIAPFPGLKVWSNTLFHVAGELWGQPAGRIV